MPCDAAFRKVARHYLEDMTAQHRAACAGRADAVHDMRIALTRLRTGIVFFSPMVNDSEQALFWQELKWLHTRLGDVRDLDVAIERMKKAGTQADDRAWKRQRAAAQRTLERALRSAKYRRLVEGLSRWIDEGSWSTESGKQATQQRSRPIGEYSARKLKRWREKLVRQSLRLKEIGDKKRHRLRLRNKRLSYAIEAVANLIPADESATETTLKMLRKAQRSLGQLNDNVRYRALAAKLGHSKAVPSEILFGHRQQKRLLNRAVTAYQSLTELKPLRI